MAQTARDIASASFSRRLIEAIDDRDVDRVCALHHPDIEMESAQTPGGLIRGAAEARAHAERLLYDNSMLAISLESVEPLAEDTLLARVAFRRSVSETGHRLDTCWLLWQLKDGLLWRQYTGSETELRGKASLRPIAAGDPSGCDV